MTQGPRLPRKRAHHGSCRVNSTSIFVAGGATYEANHANSLEAVIFDEMSRQWTRIPDLDTIRYDMICRSFNDGKVLMVLDGNTRVR